MHGLYTVLVAAVYFGTLADPATILVARTTQYSTNKTYTIQDFYQAEDFFNEWTFFTGADPTGGNVAYQAMQDAVSQGLAYVDDCDNSTVLAVDSTSSVPAGGNRPSVRITSNKSYTGGLFILDAAAMPVGCGTWPSFWSVGPNWPYAGEIDIVEGVNNQATNQMTLHSGTSSACTTSEAYTGHVMGTNCYSTASSDAGCAFSDTTLVPLGVFALLWDASLGMSMWHFARSEIPSDITNRAPNPANWGVPVGFWSSQTCDISANFYQHSLVIDTTICGNWAGGAYSSSGCPGTCSAMVANATNFVDAQWIINYVAVYQ
ncbi:glycoside hydrolase family 16 protein [Pisolithus croceorrhizus]|nr:glycoside hydrolase family 16 protein [Pisolithus croceorrhizus]